MAHVNLNDVELKIDLVASLENSTKLGQNNGENNNYWSVDWDLNYLHKYNNHRIYLVLENGVFIPNTATKTTDNNSSMMLTIDGVQFRNRIVGIEEPQLLCFVKQEIFTSLQEATQYRSINNVGNNQYIYELERIPDKSVTFKLLESRRNTGTNAGKRTLSISLLSDDTAVAVFNHIDLQFSILIMKSKK